MGGLNPYRQLSETISKKRALTQGISRKLLVDFFQISQFRVMMQEILRKLFPGKNIFPQKRVMIRSRLKSGHEIQTLDKIWTLIGDGQLWPWLRGFSGNFWISNFNWKLRFRKKFPENPLSHGRNRRNHLWKKFPEKLLGHFPFFSRSSQLWTPFKHDSRCALFSLLSFVTTNSTPQREAQRMSCLKGVQRL